MGDEQNNQFLTTRWSIVLAAKDASDGDSHAGRALEELCHAYWRPLYAFLRRDGHNEHDAQDLTQAFFATLIDKNFLQSVDQQKGRFRSFLLAAIKNFRNNQHAYTKAKKRGGGHTHVSFDYEAGERWFAQMATGQQTPEREFEYRWALTVLEAALDAVRRELTSAGNPEHFELLKPYMTGGDDSTSYGKVAESLGVSEGGARSAVHRIRRRYRRALRDLVAQTVGRQEDIDDEIRELLQVLARK